MNDLHACQIVLNKDQLRELSGSITCVVTKGFSDKIVLSSGVFAEKKRMFCCVFLLFWITVRQGIMCPPDLPATQQIVFVFMYLLGVIPFC